MPRLIPGLSFGIISPIRSETWDRVQAQLVLLRLIPGPLWLGGLYLETGLQSPGPRRVHHQWTWDQLLPERG